MLQRTLVAGMPMPEAVSGTDLQLRLADEVIERAVSPADRGARQASRECFT